MCVGLRRIAREGAGQARTRSIHAARAAAQARVMPQSKTWNAWGISGSTNRSTLTPAAAARVAKMQRVVEAGGRTVPTLDEARRQAAEVGVHGRDVGRAPLVVACGRAGSSPARQRMNSGLSMSKPSVGASALVARVAAPVELAVHQVEPDDAIDRAQLVADAQRDRRRHVTAGRLAADEQAVRAELGREPVDERPGDGDAVVGTGRPRELGRLR